MLPFTIVNSLISSWCFKWEWKLWIIELISDFIHLITQIGRINWKFNDLFTIAQISNTQRWAKHFPRVKRAVVQDIWIDWDHFLYVDKSTLLVLSGLGELFSPRLESRFLPPKCFGSRLSILSCGLASLNLSSYFMLNFKFEIPRSVTVLLLFLLFDDWGGNLEALEITKVKTWTKTC